MINLFKKIPIRYLLFFSFFCLALISTLIVATMFHINTIRVINEQSNTNAGAKNNDINLKLASIISQSVNICSSMCVDNELIYLIRDFKDLPLLQQLDREKAVSNIIHNYWQIRPEIINANIILEGQKFTSSTKNSIQPLIFVENSEWFSKIDGVSSVIIPNNKMDTDFYHSKFGTIGVITMISRIYDESHNTIGYFCADISKDYLYRNMLEPKKMMPSTEILVSDSNGQIIISSDNSNVEKLEIPKISEIFSSSQNGIANIVYKNENRMVVFSEAVGGWKTLEFIPSSALYVAASGIKSITVITILVALMLSFYLAFMMSRITSKPIIDLTKHMEEFQKDNIKTLIPNIYANEIGSLNNSFNSMLNRIEALIADVRESTAAIKHTEIMALQSQINPHFLYNALNSISWYALKENEPNISKMLDNLSQIYRNNLYKNCDSATLANELEHVKLYMDLQKQCFCESFDYHISCENNEIVDKYIPKFILQPIVENSIVHGFSEGMENGFIKISVTMVVDDNKILIEISDNGKGMSDECLSQLDSKNFVPGKYALYNVNERLRLLCGDNASISYSRNFPSGVKVIITLPGDLKEVHHVLNSNNR